jgi:hypothetical protein
MILHLHPYSVAKSASGVANQQDYQPPPIGNWQDVQGGKNNNVFSQLSDLISGLLPGQQSRKAENTPGESQLSKSIVDYSNDGRQQQKNITQDNNAYTYDANGKVATSSASKLNDIANDGNATSTQDQIVTPKVDEDNSPAEIAQRRIAYQTKIKNAEAQATALGTENGKTISELYKSAYAAEELKRSIKETASIWSSPIMQTIRQTPDLQGQEFAYFKNHGTPEQRDAVGKARAAQFQIAQAAAKQFKGSFRGFENNMINMGKPNDNDTIESAAGKMEVMANLTDLASQRDNLTGDIMEKKNVNRKDASSLADKQLNGDKIREDNYNMLHQYSKLKPEHITLKNITDAAEQMKVPMFKVIEDLQSKGYKIPKEIIDEAS